MKSKLLAVYTYLLRGEVCGSFQSDLVLISLLSGLCTSWSIYREEIKTKHLVADRVVAWSGLLTFDVAVFLLTLWQSLRIRIVENWNVTDILLRDGVFDHCFSLVLLMESLGAMYFGCVFCCQRLSIECLVLQGHVCSQYCKYHCAIGRNCQLLKLYPVV